MEQKMVIYFLQALDAEFFLMVLRLITQEHAATFNSCDDVNNVADKTWSIRLSLLVAIYCNLHRDELGAERLTMFERLTDEQFIPVLDVKAAQVLLDIEQELKDDHTLTSLKRRCIEVISYQWDAALLSIEEDNDPEGDGSSGRIVLPPLNGEALFHFTFMALTRAKEQLGSRDDKAQEAIVENPLVHHVANLSAPEPSPGTVVPPPASSKAIALNQAKDDELLGQIIVSTKPMEEMEPLAE
jgi:hypothetical protein